MIRRPNHHPAVRARRSNVLLRGVGGETLQDRGAQSTSAQITLNPYFNNNFIARWQEYARWYYTSWEARKIIDIPVEDAFRKPVILEGLKDEDLKTLQAAYDEFDSENRLKRALKQERLFGGSTMLGLFMRPPDENLADPFDWRDLRPGEYKGFNVVDVSRLSSTAWETNPFSPEYDLITDLLINGVQVHSSRQVILDGRPLVNRASQRIIENFRYNPCGFGESVLAPLYDTLTRAIGTQQGAYHLVNMASCLIVGLTNARSIHAVNGGAESKIREAIEMLSIYRAAFIDGKDVDFRQHSSSFGSVPELITTYEMLLAAGSDIPVTRFLGKSSDGMNATGQGDLENYYNNLGAWQRSYLMQRQRRIYDWTGAGIWGGKAWAEKSKDFKLVYEPLWNLSGPEQGEVDSIYVNVVKTLLDAGVIDLPTAIAELTSREIFRTEIEAGDWLERRELMMAAADPGVGGEMGGDGGGAPVLEGGKRAPAGGAYGPDGKFYEGGTFIPKTKDANETSSPKNKKKPSSKEK